MPTEDGLLRELEDRQDSSSLKRIQAYFGYLNSTEKDFFTLQGNCEKAQESLVIPTGGTLCLNGVSGSTLDNLSCFAVVAIAHILCISVKLPFNFYTFY